MNISKKIFEQVKATKGLEFNDAARCALQDLNEEIFVEAADQFSFSYRNRKFETEEEAWLVFRGIVKRLCKDRAYQQDSSAVSALRTQYNISVDAPKILTFTPVVSHNNQVSKTSSNGKTTNYPTFVDSQGRKRVRLPDGGSLPAYEPRPKHVEDSGADKIQYAMDNLASGELYTKFSSRELAEQTAKAIMAAGQAQERGDEDLKRKLFFQHLASSVGYGHGNIGQSLRNLAKNTSNLNKEENIDALHYPPPDFSL